MTTVDAGMRELQSRLARSGDPRFSRSEAFKIPGETGGGGGPSVDGASGPGLDLEVWLRLATVLGRIADNMDRRQARDFRLSKIGFVPVPPAAAVSLSGAAPGTAIGTGLCASNELGPRTGYCWVVTRVTAGGLAAGDVMQVYKGPVPDARNIPQLPNMVSPELVPAGPTWSPGNKGMIMSHGDYLSAYGTGLTSTSIVLSADAVQFEADLLADYLI